VFSVHNVRWVLQQVQDGDISADDPDVLQRVMAAGNEFRQLLALLDPIHAGHQICREEAHRNMTQLETGLVWHVSTQHMSQEDSNILDGMNDEVNLLIVHRYAEGFWVIVPDYEDLRLWIEQDKLAELGMTPAVGSIMSIALAHKIQVVRFDADAPVYTFLPTWHW